MTLLGLAGLGFGAETIATLHKGVPERVGPYSDHPRLGRGPGRPELQGDGDVDDRALWRQSRRGDRAQRAANFEARQMTTTQAGLATLDFGQVYVAIADPTPDGDVPARLYWKPLVTLIWLGAAAMALGGALSLADRRLRFGAAARAKAGRGSLAQPAE